MEEWELAYKFSQFIPDLNELHVILLKLINNEIPDIIKPAWLTLINQYTIFGFDNFISHINTNSDFDRYTHILVWKLIQKRYDDYFVNI